MLFRHGVVAGALVGGAAVRLGNDLAGTLSANAGEFAGATRDLPVVGAARKGTVLHRPHTVVAIDQLLAVAHGLNVAAVPTHAAAANVGENGIGTFCRGGGGDFAGLGVSAGRVRDAVHMARLIAHRDGVFLVGLGALDGNRDGRSGSLNGKEHDDSAA